MEATYDSLLVTSWILLGLILVKVAFIISFSYRHHIRHKRMHPRQLELTPFASIIIPCFNESKTLANCVHSLLQQTYPHYEIIIVNDGSTDSTRFVAGKLAEENRPKIRLINKENGGKASALNRGIARARGDVVVCVDADSMFLQNTLEQLILSFHDADVAAVGGNVRVANRHKLLGRQQSLEYITGLTTLRKAFAHLGCMQVISGAIGAFRRDALLSIGGYSGNTLVEDMDVTIELAKRGYKIAYNPLAIAYTEAPETLDAFIKQRFRWVYGGFQVVSKHRKALWRRRSGRIGTIGLPYFMIFPWLEVVISMLFFITMARIIASGRLGNFLVVLLFMITLQTSLVAYALITDKEDKKLLMLVLIDSFIYYHLISYTTLKAGMHYLMKKKAVWNKLERYGRNVAPLPNMLSTPKAKEVELTNLSE